ncbi:hypothetical protein BFS35_011205 [Macrococcoides goetzii]|uniref:Uncharacterized protein n=1 Tax=Macrococcoides goetzii TaxID=1891097 RepID=A0A2G5NW17_9STAP|nr:hypothetical protein [Macrococcus goetzii]RAI79706.1 hypothetical protein BFS35_011205 [Macrococcus goetzii]
MAKYTMKEQFKIGANESKYVKTLSPEEKQRFKSLSRDAKDDLIYRFMNGEAPAAPTGETKIESWLANKGIHNPTKVTIDAIHPLVTDSKLNSFTNNWAAMTTLSIDKQAIMNSNLLQQKQNYTIIAQNDEIIKQNNEIIHLLREIAQK